MDDEGSLPRTYFCPLVKYIKEIVVQYREKKHFGDIWVQIIITAKRTWVP